MDTADKQRAPFLLNSPSWPLSPLPVAPETCTLDWKTPVTCHLPFFCIPSTLLRLWPQIGVTFQLKPGGPLS